MIASPGTPAFQPIKGLLSAPGVPGSSASRPLLGPGAGVRSAQLASGERRSN